MDKNTRLRALKRLSKSRRDRAIDAMEKNTPEAVARELSEIEEDIRNMYPPKDNYEQADKKATREENERRKMLLKSLRQR